MYVGAEFSIRDSVKGKLRFYQADKNESPVNLFLPDLSAHPNYRFVETQYQHTLYKGDCIFVPAFYFY